MPTDTAPAGKYVLTVLRWDQQTSKPGEPVAYRRWRRGETVMLEGPDAERLLRARAVTAADGNRKGALSDAATAPSPVEALAAVGTAAGPIAAPAEGDAAELANPVNPDPSSTVTPVVPGVAGVDPGNVTATSP